MKMIHRYFKEIVPAEQRQEFIANAQIIDATSPAHWFFAESEQEEWDIADDFPQVASPWPACWMEFQHPGIEKLGSQTRIIPHTIKTGAVIFSQTIPKENRREFLASWGLARMAGLPIHNSSLDRFKDTTRLAMARLFEPAWAQEMLVYVESGGRFEFLFASFSYLDENGRIDRGTNFYIPNQKMAQVPDFAAICTSATLPFLFTLSLLHCKNVHLEDVPIDPAVLRSRAKKGIPKLVFKTLVVDPLRKQAKNEADNDPSGEQNHIKRAMHIARGHFKDYRDGPGLFGKYQGLFWWDMHVRGSSDAGTIVKNYRVKR